MADTLVTNTVSVIPDWTAGGGGGGVTDHGALTGLADNDHPQYQLAADGALAATTLTAGAGMTGGGDLSANRTFDVVAADATIVVNANSIQAGVMQTANIADDAITFDKLLNSAGLGVIGKGSSGAGNFAEIAAASDNQVLRRASGSIAFGTVTGVMLSGFTDTTVTIANSSGQLVSSSVTLASNVLTHAASSSGAAVSAVVSNTSNTASSTASMAVSVGGTSAGNPRFRLSVSGTTDWDIEVANATSDRLEFKTGSTTPFYMDTTSGGIRFSDGNAPSDARARFYIRHTAGDDWVEINNTNSTSTAGIHNLTFRNNGGKVMHLGTYGDSTSGTTFGVANGGLSKVLADGTAFGMALGTLSNMQLAIGTNNTLRLTITAAGSIVPGTAALATTATDGYIYMTSCAGTPTGVPTAQTGRVAFTYDSTNNRIYAYNGSWRSVAVT